MIEILGSTGGDDCQAIYCGNQSCPQMIKDPKHHERAKHIDMRAHFDRDLVEARKVIFEWRPAEDMAADILTKILPLEKQKDCAQMKGLQ